MISPSTTSSPSNTFLRIRDPKSRKVMGIEVAILAVFLLYTAILYRLSSIWDRHSPPPDTKPTSTSTTDFNHADSSKVIAVDVWFGLALIPTFDAIAIVGTCNLTIINRWHYFVSIRMMVLAYLASAIVILSDKPGTSNYIRAHPIVVFVFAMAIYGAIGACLDYFRAPPPKTSMNLREWTISKYVRALGRSNGTWGTAVRATAVTCGLAPLLTITLPTGWWGMIPLISTGFEVNLSCPFFESQSQDVPVDFRLDLSLTRSEHRQSTFAKLDSAARTSTLYPRPHSFRVECVYTGA
jgi:hypothetical protein